jgi:hypothetical protein
LEFVRSGVDVDSRVKVAVEAAIAPVVTRLNEVVVREARNEAENRALKAELATLRLREQARDTALQSKLDRSQ